MYTCRPHIFNADRFQTIGHVVCMYIDMCMYSHTLSTGAISEGSISIKGLKYSGYYYKILNGQKE